MSLLFDMPSRLVIAFLPRSKCLLIAWLQLPSALILEPTKRKSVTVSISVCYEVMGLDAMILVFWMLSYKPTFSLSSFTFINSVQFSSVAQSCSTLCDAMNRSSPGLPTITNSRSSPKPMSIESVMPSNDPILSRPLLLLPLIFPSIRVFSNESALHIRWPKYWSFSFNISSANEHPGLISFRMEWLDLLAVQKTLKSLLQHHSSNVSILQCSVFFIVQL